ncbi:MAG: formyl transferase [Cyclobacteriaceae bacterium]
MKIVIISGLAHRDREVVQEVIRNFSNVTLIHIFAEPKKKTGINFCNWVNNKGKKILKKLHNIRISRRFRNNRPEGLDCERIRFPSKEINTEKGAALIKSLQPDVLFTSQAPILKKAIFRIPKLAAINNHYGMAPQYRGNDTLFWALYYQDYEHVGGCIHYISKGVDTGNILAQVRPKIEKGDGEAELNIKTTLLLAKTVPQILGIIQKSQVLPKGKIQLEKGRNFKSSERTLYVDIKFLFLKTMGFRRVENTREKIEFFI